MKKNYFILLFILVTTLNTSFVSAQYGYIGDIKIFAGNYAPQGWLFCDGRLVSISEYEILYTIIGTTYGGDGQTTFALPNLRGRVPVGVGTGSGLSPVISGQTLGAEAVVLTQNNLPAHTHQAQISVSSGNANLAVATANTNLAKMGTYSGRTFMPALSYNTNAPDVSLGTVTTTSVGASQPVALMKPSLGVNYIIAFIGVYPPRN
jgi:microcystin-dependent protein